MRLLPGSPWAHDKSIFDTKIAQYILDTRTVGITAVAVVFVGLLIIGVTLALLCAPSSD